MRERDARRSRSCGGMPEAEEDEDEDEDEEDDEDEEALEAAAASASATAIEAAEGAGPLNEPAKSDIAGTAQTPEYFSAAQPAALFSSARAFEDSP